MNPLSKLSGIGILVLALIAGAGATQEGKKDVKIKGILPAGFKDLGLSKDQVLKIYTVQTEYNIKIADLTNKINDLKKQRSQEEFKVLTDQQRERYLKAKGLQPKEKAPKDKTVEKKPGDK